MRWPATLLWQAIRVAAAYRRLTVSLAQKQCCSLLIISWSATAVAQPALFCNPSEVQGRVHTASGKPIEGARVFVQNAPHIQDVVWYATQPEEVRLLGDAVTDADGRFTIDWKVKQVSALGNTSANASLIIQAPGYALNYRHFTLWQPRYSEIQLEAEAEHSGQVIDELGQPLANAEVLVDAIHEQMTTIQRGMIFNSEGLLDMMHSSLRPRVMTDAQGRYTLSGLPRGQIVLLQVTHPRFPSIRRFQPVDASSPQEIEAGQAFNRFSEWRKSYGLPMAMVPAQKRSVVAVDAMTGKTEPGVRVCRLFDGECTQADSDGHLTVWLSQQGEYYAQRKGETLWSRASLKEADGENTQLHLTSPKTVLGRVVDADNGRGVDGVAVYVGRGPEFQYAVTDENGEYRLTTYERQPLLNLSGPRPGYRLPVSRLTTLVNEPSLDIRQHFHSRRVRFENGRDSAEANFSVSAYPSVQAKVLSAEGKPLPGIKMCMFSAYDYFEVFRTSVVSGPNGVGQFALDRPITQSYVWTSSRHGFAVEELTATPEEPVILQLEPAIRIQGSASLVDRDGGLQSIPGLRIYLLRDDKRIGLELATTDSTGDFSVYLPPVEGEYVNLYVDFQSARHEIRVDLEAKARADFILETH